MPVGSNLDETTLAAPHNVATAKNSTPDIQQSDVKMRETGPEFPDSLKVDNFC